MTEPKPARKQIRLDARNYRGKGWYFITICCQMRRAIFSDPERARWVIERLREFAEAQRFRIHA